MGTELLSVGMHNAPVTGTVLGGILADVSKGVDASLKKEAAAQAKKTADGLAKSIKAGNMPFGVVTFDEGQTHRYGHHHVGQVPPLMVEAQGFEGDIRTRLPANAKNFWDVVPGSQAKFERVYAKLFAEALKQHGLEVVLDGWWQEGEGEQATRAYGAMIHNSDISKAAAGQAAAFSGYGPEEVESLVIRGKTVRVVELKADENKLIKPGNKFPILVKAWNTDPSLENDYGNAQTSQDTFDVRPVDKKNNQKGALFKPPEYDHQTFRVPDGNTSYLVLDPIPKEQQSELLPPGQPRG